MASSKFEVALFGGFDDHFLRADLLTGRITRVESAGRTVLYPWDEGHFVCVEDVLGRPSKTRLTLRHYSEVAEVAAASQQWASAPRSIPGHYPTFFRVGGGTIDAMDMGTATDPIALVAFVPGTYSESCPVSVDGVVAVGDSALAGPAVGHSRTVFVATADGLTVATAGEVGATTLVTSEWRPAVVELDPIAGLVAVASWNRWGSLGGPSSDIYLFSTSGQLLKRGRADHLVQRMAPTSRSAIGVVDLEGQVAVVQLVPVLD